MKKIILLTIGMSLTAQALFGNGNVEAFDKYVEAPRKKWKVPGLSIVVVQDGAA